MSATVILVLPASARQTRVHHLRRAAGEDLTLNVLLDPLEDISTWGLVFEVLDATGALLVSKSSPAGGIAITDGPDGVAAVSLTGADTGATLGPGDWLYRVRRADPGLAAILVKGRLELTSI